MNNKYLIIIAVISIAACSSKLFDEIPWQTKKIVVDGKTQEWDIPLKYFDKTTQLNYALSNDNENLYFAARTADFATIQQITMSGLQLELDTLKNTKKYPFALSFPVINMPQMGNMGAMSQGKPTEHTFNQAPQQMEPGGFNPFMGTQSKIQLLGFNGIQDELTTIPFNQAQGIFAQCNRDSLNVLSYELVIPFKTFFKDEICADDTLQILSCKITLNPISMPEPPSPSSDFNGGGLGRPQGGGHPPMGGGGPGMGEGQPPMGGGENMPSPAMNQSSNKSEKSEIKIRFRLSYKQNL